MLQVIDALPTTMTGKGRSSCCATRPVPWPKALREHDEGLHHVVVLVLDDVEWYT